MKKTDLLKKLETKYSIILNLDNDAEKEIYIKMSERGLFAQKEEIVCTISSTIHLDVKIFENHYYYDTKTLTVVLPKNVNKRKIETILRTLIKNL